MNGFKKCPNGHYYKEELSSCPYCQMPTQATGDTHTEIYTGPTIGISPKTQIYGEGTGTTTTDYSPQDTTGDTIHIKRPGAASPGSETTHTMFGEDEQETLNDGSQRVTYRERSSRKLVGWLVSYSFDSMGVDFKLYEGRNTIGRDMDCNITVNDSLISGRHAMILFRDQRYKIRDEMSTHGTFVNGEDIEDEHFELHDGDTIKLGKTIFKFRSSL